MQLDLNLARDAQSRRASNRHVSQKRKIRESVHTHTINNGGKIVTVNEKTIFFASVFPGNLSSLLPSPGGYCKGESGLEAPEELEDTWVYET